MSTVVNKVRSERGIGSILGSKDTEVASLRRALSADMSSKQWLAQNGFNKTSSSQQFQLVTDSEQPTQLDIWNSIQSNKNSIKPESDINWASILSQKSAPLPAPYIHPLTKSSRSLSQRSLEICTESLGSETGSDGFSCYSPSETSDTENQEEQEPVTDYSRSYLSRRSSSGTSASRLSFPPPLPSLSRPAGIQIRPRRADGRLVLEAVPAPAPSHNFHAQRQGGRLLLTIVGDQKTQVNKHVDETEQEEEEIEEEKIEKTEKKEEELEKPIVASGAIDVQLSALRMKKLLTNMNPKPAWSSKLKQLDEREDDPVVPVPAISRVPRLISSSVPPPKTGSFNTYEYCWRTKQATISVGINHPISHFSSKSYRKRSLASKNLSPQEHQFVVLKADYYMDPTLKCCKEPIARRSFLFREPCCIATS